MSDMGVQEAERGGGEPRIFECGNCGTIQLKTAVSYDRYGYAVCPVCDHTNRP